MIPEFGPDGALPPGIHITTLKEFEQRFSTTIVRRGMFIKLLKLIEDLRGIGCSAIYVDGSFTTTKRIPGDMDICWENTGVDSGVAFAKMPILFDFANGRRNQQMIYNADIFPAHLIEGASGMYFIDFFQRDKATGNPKGIVQIDI